MPDGGSQTQTSTTSPWPGATPYWTGGKVGGQTVPGILPQAAAWYQSAQPQYYTGQTIAGFTDPQLAAQQGIINRATAGSPLNQASAGYLQDVIGGRYLNSGAPGSDLTNSIWSTVAPKVQSTAELAGRFGSGSEAQALTSSFTNAIAPFSFNQFQNERQQQLAAAQLAPQQAATDYQDLAALQQVGLTQQQQEQQGINADISKFNFNQNLPLSKLQAYEAAIQGVPGSTTSLSTPQPSIAQQILGGVTSLGQIAGIPTSQTGTVGSSIFGK